MNARGAVTLFTDDSYTGRDRSFRGRRVRGCVAVRGTWRVPTDARPLLRRGAETTRRAGPDASRVAPSRRCTGSTSSGATSAPRAGSRLGVGHVHDAAAASPTTRSYGRHALHRRDPGGGLRGPGHRRLTWDPARQTPPAECRGGRSDLGPPRAILQDSAASPREPVIARSGHGVFGDGALTIGRGVGSCRPTSRAGRGTIREEPVLYGLRRVPYRAKKVRGSAARGILGTWGATGRPSRAHRFRPRRVAAVVQDAYAAYYDSVRRCPRRSSTA